MMKLTNAIYSGVLCTVLFSAVVSAAVARFNIDSTTNGEPVVTDLATGRMWQQGSTLDTPTTWAAALAHCESMTYAGYTDWRLPSINELLTLVDEKKEVAPAINTVFFTNFESSSSYWTATTHRRQDQAAYVIYFNEQNTTIGKGGVGGLAKTFTAQALCVRTEN